MMKRRETSIICWCLFNLLKPQAIFIGMQGLSEVKIITRRLRMINTLIDPIPLPLREEDSITRQKTCPSSSLTTKIHSRKELMSNAQDHIVSWTSSSKMKRGALSGITRILLQTYLTHSVKVLMLYHLGSTVPKAFRSNINLPPGICRWWWVCTNLSKL